MLRRITHYLIALLLVLLILVTVFVGTAPGNRALLAAAASMSGGAFAYAQADGALPQGLRLTDLQINTASATVHIDRLELDSALLALFRRSLRIRELNAGRVSVVLHDTGQADESSSKISIPLKLELQQFAVTALRVRDEHNEIVSITDIAVKLLLERSGKLSVHELSAFAQGHRFSVSGHVQTAAPYTHDLDVLVESAEKGNLPVSMRVQAQGDAVATNLSVQSTRTVAAQLVAELNDLLQTPRGKISGRFQSSAPDLLGPGLSLEGALEAQFHAQDSSTVELAITANSDIHGQWKLDSHASSNNLDSLRLDNLEVEGPGQAQLTGTGVVFGPGRNLSEMELDLRWSALASPGIAGVKSPLGTARLNWSEGVIVNAEATVQADAFTDAIELKGVSVLNRQQLQLQNMQVSLRDLKIVLNGSFGLDAVNDMQLRGTWSGLSLVSENELELGTASGRIAVTGALADYSFNASGSVGLSDSQTGDVSVEGRGSTEQLSHLAMRLQSGNSGISADGSLSWADGPGWQLALRAHDFDPGLLDAAWPGAISADVISTGMSNENTLNWSAQINALQGELRERPISGVGVLRGEGGTLHADDLQLRSGASEVLLNGTLAPGKRMSWRLDSPDLNDWAPQISGSITGNGVLTGELRTPLLQAVVRAKDLAFQDLRVASVDADIDADFSAGGRVASQLSGRSLAYRQFRLDNIDMTVTGTSEQHNYEVAARGPALALSAFGSGQYSEKNAVWLSQLRNLDLAANDYDWALQAPTELAIGKQMSLSASCMSSKAGKICLGGERGGKGQWRVAGDVESLNLDAFATQLYGIAGTLNSVSFEAAGNADSVTALASSLEAQKLLADFNTDAGEDLELQIDSARIDIVSSATAVRGETRLDIAIEAASAVGAQFELPPLPWKFDEMKSLPLNGTASIELESLSVLEKWTADLEQLSGQASVSVDLSGTLGVPVWNGSAALAQAQAFVPAAGILITSEVISAEITQDGRLTALAQIRSGEGQVDFEGKGHLDKSGLHLEASIQGSDFQAANLPEAEVLVSPQLNLKFQPGQLRISGDVLIPVANIAPTTFSGSGLEPSDDVVVVDAKESGRTDKTAIYSDVNIQFGDAVRFSAQGFNTRIAGGLKVRDEPGKPTKASGELRLLDGAYSAYGQSLSLENGRITYAGGPIDDPGVDAVAVREVDGVRAGIKASGRLREPVIALFSSPEMDDRDILSYILLGRALGGASESDAGMLVNAASSLGLQKGEMISRGIASRFGIDDLSLSGSPGDGQLAVTVGKYLSPKLYLGYGVGLLEPSNTVLMRYKVLENWQLEAETGTTSGADILYTIER